MRIKKGALLKLGFGGVLAFAILSGINSDLFEIREVKIDELFAEDQLGRHEVFESQLPQMQALVQKYQQKNIWKINVSEISKTLKEVPGIKNVIVERLPPHTLRISVEPEVIRFLFAKKNGTFLPVTESATILTNFKSKRYPDAPLTREEKIMRDSNIRAQAVDLVSSLPSAGLFSKDSVAEIEYEGKSFWLSLMQPDVKVKINPPNVKLKSERVEKVLDYTRKHNLHARVIDSEYSKKVVVKLRKDR